MKFSVHNLGCKVNHYDAESVAAALEEAGWERVKEDEETDAVLLFTCCVTNAAAAKSRQALHKAHRYHPQAALVYIGCAVQALGQAPEEADLILGSGQGHLLPAALNQWRRDHRRRVLRQDAVPTSFEELFPQRFENNTRAVLKVQDGCQQFCSYCIVPYARGPERSLDPDLAVAEARRLALSHSEIVLSGIHLGRYGKPYGLSLADLVEKILAQTPVRRLRLSSIEVTEIDDHLMALLADDRVARHLHIPLQSGSDAVLRRMGRPYDTAAYRGKIDALRARVRDLAISTDLMVGFPGESEEEFRESLSFVQSAGFAFLHVFPYSPREGTPAYAMVQVEENVKKERTRRCLQLSERLLDTYQKAWLGRTCQVLMEKGKEGWTPGYASQYFQVRMPGRWQRGEIYEVRCVRYQDHQLWGELA